MTLLLTICLFSQPLTLTLEKAVEMALKRSPVLQQSYYSKQISTFSLINSTGDLLASASITGNYTNFDYFSDQSALFINPPEYYTINAGIETKAFSPTALWSVLNAYNNRIISILQYEYTRNQLIFQVKSEYLNALRNKHLLEVSKKALKRAELYYRLTKEKLALGSATKLDLLKAEVQMKKAKLDILNAERAYKTSLYNLLKLIGFGLKSEVLLVDVQIVDTMIYLPPLREVEEMALKYNHTLKEVKTQYNNKKIDLAYDFLSIIPSVTFGYYWDYGGSNRPSSINTFSDKRGWSISLSFNLLSYPINILNGYYYKKQKEAYYKTTLFEVIKNVRDAYMELRNSLESLSLSKSSLQQANEAYNLAKEQYALGKISILDLLDVEESLKTSEVSYIETIYNLEIAKEKLNFQTGMEVIK
ncbi:MAG: hypothetical protein DRI52_10680 [Chloroflexi bacterium]|nr:MAG: hypothetical protein DRI52_10680 [Chloroflexota bacterium]